MGAAGLLRQVVGSSAISAHLSLTWRSVLQLRRLCGGLQVELFELIRRRARMPQQAGQEPCGASRRGWARLLGPPAGSRSPRVGARLIAGRLLPRGRGCARSRCPGRLRGHRWCAGPGRGAVRPPRANSSRQADPSVSGGRVPLPVMAARPARMASDQAVKLAARASRAHGWSSDSSLHRLPSGQPPAPRCCRAASTTTSRHARSASRLSILARNGAWKARRASVWNAMTARVRSSLSAK